MKNINIRADMIYIDHLLDKKMDIQQLIAIANRTPVLLSVRIKPTAKDTRRHLPRQPD
jgi:hypothetical protein